MKARIKKAWIEALRSGQYEQTICSLASEGKYCSLGVLCIAAGKKVEYSSVDKFLPIGTQGRLQYMNDSQHLSFSEIADWIEANIDES